MGFLGIIFKRFSSLSSDKLVVDDVYEPETYLFLQGTICDRNLLHVLVIAHIVIHDISCQLACLHELFHLKQQPVKVQTLLLLFDYLDCQNGRE